MNVFIGIGNSDDKLTQGEWAMYVEDVENILVRDATQIHIAGFSRPDAPWQNACWFVETDKPDYMKGSLTHLLASYRQDSICWAPAVSEFLRQP